MNKNTNERQIATAAAKNVVEELHNVGNLRDASADINEIRKAEYALLAAQAEYERAENAAHDAGK